MRVILTTSLLALALAGVVVSCSPYVQPTLSPPTPTELSKPTVPPIPTPTTSFRRGNSLRQQWARITPYPTAVHTPIPTRTATPTTEPVALTATVAAQTTATVEALQDQMDIATAVALGKNRHCSQWVNEKIAIAMDAGKEFLTGSEIAALVGGMMDALDCSEYPSQDSRLLQCLRETLKPIRDQYDLIGSRKLSEVTDIEARSFQRVASETWRRQSGCRIYVTPEPAFEHQFVDPYP